MEMRMEALTALTAVLLVLLVVVDVLVDVEDDGVDDDAGVAIPGRDRPFL